MTAQRDPGTVFSAWLDEGPTELPDATRRAILTSLPTTSQARRGPFAPWRFSQMNTTSRLVAAAIVAVVAIGGAIYLIGPRSGVGTPTPAPTATSAPPSAVTATPSNAAPSLVPTLSLDTSTWTPFSSTMFGFDVRYPSNWRLEAGTTPPTIADLTSADRQYFDHFVAGNGTVTELYGTSSRIPAGMSEDEWVAAYRQPVVDQFGPACFPARDQWELVTVDGHAGGLYVGCNYVESTTFVNGVAYIFTYALPLGSQPGTQAKATLQALLSTVTIHPGGPPSIAPS